MRYSIKCGRGWKTHKYNICGGLELVISQGCNHPALTHPPPCIMLHTVKKSLLIITEDKGVTVHTAHTPRKIIHHCTNGKQLLTSKSATCILYNLWGANNKLHCFSQCVWDCEKLSANTVYMYCEKWPSLAPDILKLLPR